jgi:hypothetical protein
MTSPEFFSDLKFLLDHVYREPEKAVRRWSSAECSDFQVPIALITGFLFNSLIPNRPVRLNLRDKPEYRAVIEIVENSQLQSLLEFDREGNCVRFRQQTPDSVIREVAEFVSANTTGCA